MKLRTKLIRKVELSALAAAARAVAPADLKYSDLNLEPSRRAATSSRAALVTSQSNMVGPAPSAAAVRFVAQTIGVATVLGAVSGGLVWKAMTSNVRGRRHAYLDSLNKAKKQ